MVIYEVSLEVDTEIVDAFDAWLVEHADEMVMLPGFVSATLSRVDGDGGRARRCAQYVLRDRAALDAYLSGPAAAMRAAGVARFGGRFDAVRRVLAPFAERVHT